MNKLFMMLLALAMTLPSCAYDDGRPISMDRLPKESRTLLDTYFAEKTCMLVKKENREYEVVFKGGESVEFDKRGKWKDIDCRATVVPDDLVPEQIRTFVRNNYPENHIVKIERDYRGYEIKLNNQVELDFNRNFVLTELDFDD